jgi:subtilisin family serine protease
MVKAGEAHAGATGTGAVVAVIDSGVKADHPDLAGRLLKGHDFVDEDDTPQDDNGHGTHVAGIVVANEGNGIGVGSVAPGAKVLPVRVLGADGSGTVEDVKQGVDYAVAQGADVINLSLGEDVPLRALVGERDEVDDSIDKALDKGIVVVAAAGNSGFPVCTTPGGRGRMLCVAAVDRSGKRTLYSNYGDGLAISAPGGGDLPLAGEGILSTWNDGDYAELTGTSQATPHVAGAAALLVSRGVTGKAAADLLLKTATDAGEPGPDPDYGAGILNAAAAVAATRTTSGGGGGGGNSSARIATARTHKIADVLRRGLPVTCTASGNGRCSVRVTRNGKLLATGSKPLAAGKPVTVYARVTSYGRRTLGRARKLTVRITARLPGSKPLVRRATLKR